MSDTSKLLPFLLWVRASAVSLALLMLAACGARTGLLVDREADAPDATVDADRDVVRDSDPDPDPDVEADVEVFDEPCIVETVPIVRRRAEVLFVIDRSGSMAYNLDGEEPAPGELSRWRMLQGDLEVVLVEVEHLLDLGAKFYPLRGATGVEIPRQMCVVDPEIELPPAPYNNDAFQEILSLTRPAGGTPTAAALEAARDFLVESRRPEIAQFVVLATDGIPNCNDGLTVPCVCSSLPEYCDGPDAEPIYCFDDARTLAAVASTAEGFGIPIYIIGFDHPAEPAFADFLDELALAGGRPRGPAWERQFYMVQREGDLRAALQAVTTSIARCVFTVAPAHGLDPRLELLVDGDVVPNDLAHGDGWDWTDPEAGELTIFGDACDRAADAEATISARLGC